MEYEDDSCFDYYVIVSSLCTGQKACEVTWSMKASPETALQSKPTSLMWPQFSQFAMLSTTDIREGLPPWSDL